MTKARLITITLCVLFQTDLADEEMQYNSDFRLTLVETHLVFLTETQSL